MKIYIPNKDNYKCFVVQSEEVVRAYENIPNYNTTINYRDYYIRSDYIYKDGTQQFGNYYGNLPICLDDSTITDNIYYRYDFDKSLVVFVLLCIICFGMPLKIFMRMFKRFR